MKIFIAFEAKLICFPWSANTNLVFIPIFFSVEKLHQIQSGTRGVYSLDTDDWSLRQQIDTNFGQRGRDRS